MISSGRKFETFEDWWENLNQKLNLPKDVRLPMHWVEIIAEIAWMMGSGDMQKRNRTQQSSGVDSNR